MNALWNIHADEIRRRLQSTDEFFKFLDQLLQATSLRARIPSSALKLNSRQEIPDGGVDAVVELAIQNETSGRMNVPTAWQYKASNATNAVKPRKKKKGGAKTGLIDEIQKPYVKVLIKKGYGYRFCICDNLPPQTKEEWEAHLKSETLKINPNAVSPMIVTVDDLSIWANEFPAICVAFFRPHLKFIPM